MLSPNTARLQPVAMPRAEGLQGEAEAAKPTRCKGALFFSEARYSAQRPPVSLSCMH